jgi:uncharacterized protein YkwD
MDHMKKIIVKRFAGLVICILAATALWSCAAPAKKVAGQTGYVAPVNGGAANFALSDMEKEAVRQLNDLRVNPKEWAAYLKTLKPGSDGTDEAALFLRNKTPLAPLKVSKGLCLAARDLVMDHGPKGLTGHKGSDGSTSFERIGRYGEWDGKAGENLYYGYKDPDRLMAALLTEGGSQGWEQRNNALSKDFKAMGISCGPHRVHRTMCVIDFAEIYTEAP